MVLNPYSGMLLHFENFYVKPEHLNDCLKPDWNSTFRGVERLFRFQSHFENFYVEP